MTESLFNRVSEGTYESIYGSTLKKVNNIPMLLNTTLSYNIRNLIYIFGQPCSGKTSLAISLAKFLGGCWIENSRKVWYFSDTNESRFLKLNNCQEYEGLSKFIPVSNNPINYRTMFETIRVYDDSIVILDQYDLTNKDSLMSANIKYIIKYFRELNIDLIICNQNYQIDYDSVEHIIDNMFFFPDQYNIKYIKKLITEKLNIKDEELDYFIDLASRVKYDYVQCFRQILCSKEYSLTFS
jgi:hypothetical protein